MKQIAEVASAIWRREENKGNDNMMKRQHNLRVTLGLLALSVVFVAQQALALPSFARKYQTSCVTCHEAFPRLNAIGEAFRLNGYKFLDDELYVKEEPVELGDEAYKRLWPRKAIWPSDIPGTAPISLKLTSDYQIDTGGTRDASSQFVFPSEGKVLAAGSFGENISFFFELVFAQGGGGGQGHGHGAGGGEESELSTSLEGWVQFEDLLGVENALNLRIGTVGMQEFGLFTARNHNRLTVNPYLYSSWSIPSFNFDEHILEGLLGDGDGDGDGLGYGDGDGHDKAIHTFDEHLIEELLGGADAEGNMFTIHAQPGVELNGFGRRWRYAAGIVNGSGSVSDNNSEKDLYLQLAYKFGGRTFDGSIREGESALGGGEPWRDDSVIVSLFGYRGTGSIRIAHEVEQDDFWRFGPGIQWKYRDLTLGGGYIWGNNDNAYGSLSNESIDSQAWFVEAQYFLLPWLIPTIRYEGISIDLASGTPALFVQKEQDRERVIVSAKALIRANVSLTVEGRFYTKDERFTSAPTRGSTGDNDQVVISLSYAF